MVPVNGSPTVVASLRFGTVASYYVRTYYHGGEVQLAARWYAPGNSFGLTDGEDVDPTKFQRLHAGLGDNGQALLTTTGRKVDALDLTFSASKSISVAYALTDDENLRQAILDAHHKAVRAALAVLDKEAIYARRGKNGLIREAVDLSAAVFTHDSARPEVHEDGALFADPQIHSHAILLSLAERRSDGTVGTIDTRIGKFKMLAGSVYHAHCSHLLSNLGFSITDIGKNGVFEIGLDARVRDYYSARRTKIVDTLSEAGLTSADAPEIAAVAALATRRTKTQTDSENRFALWQDRARNLGLDPSAVVENLRGQSGSDQPGDEELQRRLQAIPRQLTEFESTFARRDLLRAVAVAYVGTSANPEAIIADAERLIDSGAVIEVRREGHEPVLSTPDMVRLERETLEYARRLAQASWRGLDKRELDRACKRAKLSVEQHFAVAALTDGRPIAFLEGRAGVGKTHSLKPYVARLQAEGFRVIATATAWRTALMLQDELGIEARALDSWLKIAESGGNFIDDRTVLLVDEAGQLGVRATHSLFFEFSRILDTGSRDSKLVLLGDRAQLAPIAASCGLDILEQAQSPIRLETVVRQRDPANRRIVEHLARGDVRSAIDALHTQDCVVERANRRLTVVEAVDRWIDARTIDPKRDHLLLARTQAVIRGLNDEVRRRMRRDGALAGEDVIIAAATPAGNPFDLALAVGDRIRFGRRAAEVGSGVINGTTGRIEHIVRTTPGQAEIVARIGRSRVTFRTNAFKGADGRVRIAHDYAQSVYSAQGLTSETCIVVAEPTFDRHDLYVSASRARGKTTLVVDRAAIDAHVRAERAVSQTQAEVTANERSEALTAAWSRRRVKSTTLDITAPRINRESTPGIDAPGLHSNGSDRDRRQGLDHAL